MLTPTDCRILGEDPWKVVVPQPATQQADPCTASAVGRQAAATFELSAPAVVAAFQIDSPALMIQTSKF